VMPILAAAQQNIPRRAFGTVGTVLLRKSEFRNCYRVLYCLPASGAVGVPPLGGEVGFDRVWSTIRRPGARLSRRKRAPFLRAR
jgi:hypothetical protein